MKFRFHLPLLSVLALGAAGCSTNKEQIVFSDETAAQTQSTNVAVAAAVAPEPPKLAKPDQQKIEQVVYAYLLGRHFWDNGDYTAVFLQTSDDQTALLQSQFPAHVPPIKPSYRANLPANRTPVDRDTGKPAMLLSVDVNEPNPDGTVDAIGRWYAGGAVTGYYTFQMQKIGDTWQIVTLK